MPASASGAAGYAVYYGYDVAGLQTYARFGSAFGPGITNAYDGLGRLLSSTSNMDGTARTVSSAYDAASNRTQVATSSGFDLRYSYDAAGRMTGLLDAGGTSLAAFTYDAAGRRSGLSFLGGVSTVGYGYDALGRLSSLTHDLAGTAGDQTYGFTYNAASQIVTRTGSNDAYASNTAYAVTRNYTVNGLNQYTSAGPATFGYDANANLTSDGSTAFVYDAENRLVSASGAKNATLSYDPMGRLWQVAGSSGTVRFLYDGDRLLEEYDASGNRLRMFAHGQGADEPLAWWENMGGSWQLRFLHADHQGSIVSLNDVGGNVLNISPYDTWGIPNAGNWGRFMYTGQVYLADLGLYYYKARMYSPTLGRFMQTDPIGYDDQINLYGYVGNDPVNETDPTGEAIAAGCGSRLGDSASCSGETILGRIEAANQQSSQKSQAAPGSKQTQGQNLLAPQPHGDCDTRAQCDFARDEAATLAGKMSPEDFRERGAARGMGALLGAAPYSESVGLLGVRVAYMAGARSLGPTARVMLAFGRSPEGVARWAVGARNGLKVMARAFTPSARVAQMEARNLARYGNPVGPTADQLFAKYGSWEAVISAATRTAGLLF